MSDDLFLTLALGGIAGVVLVQRVLRPYVRKRRLVASARALAHELGLEVAGIRGFRWPTVLLRGTIDGERVEAHVGGDRDLRVVLQLESPVPHALDIFACNALIRARKGLDGECSLTGDEPFDAKYAVVGGEEAARSLPRAAREALLRHHHTYLHIREGSLKLMERPLPVLEQAAVIHKAIALAQALRAAFLSTGSP